ncbi:agmatinase family protein [Sphingomonas sp. LaA6.9]|uniref:agmatinase family protein n=1 Tax=Sphingomonas sp. LaA6.9 TaxID=2919914 RepID=UPI001F4FF50A|nr:agmatinase family protein [Sphingomonas sp. LaA6.9]MCJ8156163.1 agmatinase family protein [Sphingomonas sp. LaA6.9]
MTTPVPIHLIGLPTDCHSSFLRGPAKAPAQIRAALTSDHGNPASERGTELGVEIDLVDRGDVMLDEGPEDDERITGAVAASLDAGAIPIIIGGDHAVSYPILKAIAAAHGPVTILHFDAHPDTYDELGGDRRSHASPFARIMEDGLAKRLVQVGIRTMNRHCREQAERFGIEVIEARHFRPGCLPALQGPLYISIDLDGFDPAFAPGVSHHEPGGLSVRDVTDILLNLEVPIAGADVVELNPTRDINGMTAVVAAKMVKELAALATAHPARAHGAV